jgi:DNA polymerase alpha-associated DNA helicase A
MRTWDFDIGILHEFFRSMDRALDSLERIVIPSPDSNGRPALEMNPLMRVLLGYGAPSPLAPKPEITFFDPSLNQSQKEAVYFSLQAQEVACIHGPPGQ